MTNLKPGSSRPSPRGCVGNSDETALPYRPPGLRSTTGRQHSTFGYDRVRAKRLQRRMLTSVASLSGRLSIRPLPPREFPSHRPISKTAHRVAGRSDRMDFTTPL
jgi:hypothetical protein